jgi:hypothetical protein
MINRIYKIQKGKVSLFIRAAECAPLLNLVNLVNHVHDLCSIRIRSQG